MFEFERNLAVIIGIDAYGQGIPPLTTAANDAKKIAQLLQDEHQYHQVWTFLDDDATQSRLKDLLQQTLPNTVQANDRLVFYFAGHGIALPGEEGPQGYLIPQDAKLGDSTTYIRMTEVEKALTQLTCRHCLVILDCCFAGAFRWASTRDIAAVPENIYKERYDRFIADPAWQVITSAAYDQKALDSLKFIEDSDRGNIDGQHSPFAAALIEALSGKADAFPPAQDDKPAGDGIITATELYLYLRDRVEVLTEKHNKRQTPGLWLLKKHDKGEYIFLTQDFNRDSLKNAPSLDAEEENNPYRGLKPYEKEHADLFFGRTSLIEKLCDFVSEHRLTIVLGASGSGKSSLVKAGLIPHLEDPRKLSRKRDLNQKIQSHQHNQQAWHILPVIRPGESPLNSLSTAFKDIVPAGSEVGFSEAIVFWSEQHPDSRILLTIDQFEELITQCKDESERKELLKRLAITLQACSNFSLILTLRSDFEPQFRDTALEADWKEARFIVPAMTREELREAIEEPASAKVVFFKPHELIEQLIDEVAQMPGALPLLSFALSELYLKLAQRYLDAQNNGEIAERAITQSDYDELGGVTRSLTQRADREYEALTKEDPAYEHTIRHVMLRMVAVGGELARRRVLKTELEYPKPEKTRVEQVIKLFADARLLTSDKDVQDRPYVEPAHDVLVRGWKRLLDWKEEEQENLILQRRITPSAEEWRKISKEEPTNFLHKFNPFFDWFDEKLNSAERLFNKLQANLIKLRRQALVNQEKSLKASQFLWNTDPRLDLLNQVLESKDNWLNQEEQEFIENSLRKRRDNRRRTTAIATSVVLILLLLTIWALQNAVFAGHQAAIAKVNGRNLGAENFLISNRNLEAMTESLNIGQDILRGSPNSVKEDTQLQTATTLWREIDANQLVGEHNRIEPLPSLVSSIYSVSFSPDGQMLASAKADNSIELSSLKGRNRKTLRGHESAVYHVSFSPNRQMLASASADNTIKLWSIDGRERKTLRGHESAVYHVSFSPDGQMLASASNDGTIKLWNSEGQELKTFRGHEGAIYSVSFRPDGKAIASTGWGTVKLWNLNGEELRTFPTNSGWVRSVSFSPIGSFIAFAGDSNMIELRHPDKKLDRTLRGHESTVWDINFSPDGTKLVSASEDGTVKLWDVNDGRELKTLRGHEGTVWSASFSPDGKTIASASDDSTIKLWQFFDRSDIKVLRVHRQGVTSLSFSHDGKWLLSASIDGKVWLWNLEGQEPKLINRENSPVWSASFSPDNKTIAFATNDNVVNLWSFDRQESNKLEGHKERVGSLNFSPDGQAIASASWDGTVKLWDLNGRLLQSLEYHDDKDNKDIPIRVRVLSVSFSPDGKTLLATGDDKTLKLWSDKGQVLKTLTGNYSEVTSATFSPNGQMIVSANTGGRIILWSLEGKQIRSFQAHRKGVSRVSFSPDGKTIISASQDKTIKLWSIDGLEIQTLRGHDSAVWDVAFSPDGKTIASASKDSTIRLWDLDLSHLMTHGCNWVKDYEGSDHTSCQGY